MLGYIIVVALALAVGALVYLVSMRLGDATDSTDRAGPRMRPAKTRADPLGRRADPSLPEAPLPLEPSVASEGGGGSYIPVSGGRPSWQSRLNGAMGLVVAISVAAITLAIALYEAGSLIVRLMSNAAKSG